MESSLFTVLSTDEEANLSGGSGGKYVYKFDFKYKFKREDDKKEQKKPGNRDAWKNP